ncbi:carbohydrate ABC transporter permease [Paracoccus sp. (in: a-proteobacteria)]|uniref:carbohydrate ABC transporter permease n=1 Tax=Paracoccus sp. TaxID=267 RepID=UPI0040583EDD
MANAKALQQPLGLRLTSAGFLILWCLLAAFPIFWITVMSFKSPVDAFSPNPLAVIFGPRTRAEGNGLSIIDIVLGLGLLWLSFRLAFGWLPRMVDRFSRPGTIILGWIIAVMGYALTFVLVFFVLLPVLLAGLNAIAGPLGQPIIGLTTENYRAVWVENQFYRNFINSMIVTGGVVTISLTVGTLAGYGLSRSGSNLAFWLLIVALVFRALPHSVLVAGYLPVFINSAEILRPILGDAAPTLYGQPYAVIAVLVAINQPFTIWMLRSFFQNIPTELDEAARVDGCSHFQAFRRVIMPVMWPGVITTGLFSFLLAYNDFLVASLLLDAQNQTMVPAIASYFNRETTTTDQVEAIAAAVSITAPLFLLVMVFQRQIVSGLTAGAVKG